MRGKNQLFVCDKSGAWVNVQSLVQTGSAPAASDVEAVLERASDGITSSFRSR